MVTFLKRYHGYYFSWAILYTFWYYPLELTMGHLLGVFYLFALLMIGSGVMSWQLSLRIPVGEYALVLIVSLLLWVALALVARGRRHMRAEIGEG